MIALAIFVGDTHYGQVVLLVTISSDSRNSCNLQCASLAKILLARGTFTSAARELCTMLPSARLAADDRPVHQDNFAIHARGQAEIVGDRDNRLAVPIHQLTKDLEHLFARF
jgi:hypothetical protein